jgi:serine/threonine protein kinase/formylglycine-generating enzyme required for sulfatase activity/tetratricopeptide (TPR) repeat protein
MTERDIFLALLDLPDPTARAAYLDEACRGDPGLRARVESLLRSHADAGSFLGTPTVAPAVPERHLRMSDSNPSAADPFGQIADEFVEALRQGQRPSVEEFARRYPAHADDIRDMLPALALMEQAKAPGAQGQRDPADVAPLRQLGDYQILREVGRGGMGVVYEARQLSLGRHVAIKVLPSHALLDPRQLGRFQREARSAARLHHTNIVPVFGIGEQDGLHYYVMQFIPGLGLDHVLDELRRLRRTDGKLAPAQAEGQDRPIDASRDVSAAAVARGLLTGACRQPGPAGAMTSPAGEPAAATGLGPSDPARAANSSATIRLPGQSETSTLSESGRSYWQSVARIGVQVADALAHAAGQGILHRDIKPSNLLLDDAGNVWVTDFGLAKGESDGDDLTHTGDIVGTLRYMAPERFNGNADVRSDVYALGLTLYELLALRPAFDEADRNKLVNQVMHEEPPRPRRLNPGVPRDLETVVLKATARDPAHRYQTPGAMAEDLKRFLEDRPVRARRISVAERLWRSCRRNPVVAGMAAAVVLALAAGATVSYLKYLDAEQQKGIALEKEKVAKEKEQEARREADNAAKAREFLVSIFQRAQADENGGNVTVRQLLQDADTRIPVEFAQQPELRAELVKAIGAVRRGIGRRSPQAMILEVRGTVESRSAAGEPRPAVPQALLNLDDRLTLSADAQVLLVFLADFHKERLKPGREVTIDIRGCEPADAVLERDDRIVMTFVRLPPGTFYRAWDGTPGSAKWTEIKEGFEIAVHDVTQGQWEAIMGYNPSSFSRRGAGRDLVRDITEEELKLFPVDSVMWWDVQEFLKRLNEKERGRGYLYRLPTTAEWEYACRGGPTSQQECSYHFYFDKPTNDLSSERANFDGRWPAGEAPKGPFLQRTTRVGAYPPNKLGLCDMHGNVCQWTGTKYYTFSTGFSYEWWAYVGSSWNSPGKECQAGLQSPDSGGRWTNRIDAWGPSNVSKASMMARYDCMGFRLVRVPDGEAALAKRFAALLRGEDKPADDVERLIFAQAAYDREKFAVAARLWAEALASDPKPGGPRRAWLRCSVTRAASRAAAGQGTDDPPPDDAAKAKLRRMALDCLKAELAAWRGQPNTDPAFRQWLADPALAGVRDKSALDKLPADERHAFAETWAEVAALLPMRERAQHNAGRGDWQAAAACYARLLADQPLSDGELGFEYAAVLLLSGDQPGYRKLCREMLDRGGQARVRHYHVARACTLAPDSVKDPALPGQRAADELKQNKGEFWSLTEQGALAYRAGRHDEAATLLEGSLRAANPPGRAVLNWLWLSLVEHRRGKPAEARAWLDKATKWLEEYPQYPEGAPAALDVAKGLHLHNWLEAQILRREAEALLGPKK